MFSWKSRVDFCRLCRFGFRDKQRKRNVVGEFTKMFEKVVGVKVFFFSECLDYHPLLLLV